MSRGKQLRLNTLVGLLSQLVTLICGFVIPKLVLSYYGTEVNGLVSSITHFLSFISLAECGMGVVVQSSLYKPLAEHDDVQISRVVISAERFFGKIGIILVCYIVCLIFAYPFIAATTFDWFYTATLIVAISISTFVQYFICMSYRLLLVADQKGYIQLFFNIITQIISTILCVLLAMFGYSIQLLKLCTSVVMLLQPVLLTVYVKKHYRINKKVEITEEPIKQKWNGIAQHIAYVILENTPTVVLTIFSTMANVSIYNVYYLVVNGIKCVITSAVSGMQSLLGNMCANDEKNALNLTFSYYEWIMHAAVVFLYTCTAILIVPFVKVYTLGITDANYVIPIFGLCISISQMLYCLRLPYNAMIFVAGHYKETQISALIEAGINIVLSVVLVFKLGVVGVAIGTIVAMAYRMVYFAVYLRKNITMRPFRIFLKHIVIDIIAVVCSLLATSSMSLTSVSYTSWLLLSVKVAIVVGAIVVSLNILFYFNLIREAILTLKKKRLNNND